MIKKSLLVFIALLIVGLTIVFVWRGIYLPQKSVSALAVSFVVQKGEGVWEISNHLKDQGLIKNSIYFQLYVFWSGNTRKLQAGEYSFSSAMNISQIVDKMVAGNVVKKQLTILEGWNLRDIASYLEAQRITSRENLFKITGTPSLIYDSSVTAPQEDFSKEFTVLTDKPKNISLEGYLFPDTYEVIGKMSLEDVVRKMLENFNQKLTPDLKSEIVRQRKTIFEIVTMASLIEKEVSLFDDKKIVAGILWKRLEVGMRLQVDATITYITGKKSTAVSVAETKIDSPYNTYKYAGLPMGPIANPGLESIRATLYPKKSNYWYYLSTPEGRTIFSRTLAEHNFARARYLK